MSSKNNTTIAAIEQPNEPSSSLSIKFLQVGCGDGIIISYRVGEKSINIVIDGGYKKYYKDILKPGIEEIEGDIDLWILTHLDGDHINGLVDFLKDTAAQKTIKKVWFNCFDNFQVGCSSQKVAMSQAIQIRDFLVQRGTILETDIVAGKTFSVEGLHIEVLSPSTAIYSELERHWDEEEKAYRERKGFTSVSKKGNNDYQESIQSLISKPSSEAGMGDIVNISSIVFVLHVKDKKAIFLGDAHHSTLSASLAEWRSRTGIDLGFDLVKLSHHGSKYNFHPDLFDLFKSSVYAICADGSKKYYLPDKETLAKIIAHEKRDRRIPIEILFNNDNDEIRSIFNIDSDIAQYQVDLVYPADKTNYSEKKWDWYE